MRALLLEEGIKKPSGSDGGCGDHRRNPPPPIGGVTKSAQLRFRLRRKLRSLPLLRLSPRDPLRWARAGALNWSCRKENGPHPQGVRRIRKRQSRQRLRSGRSKRKNRCGGSVRASAYLRPPAGEGWRSLVAVRDGNAFPLEMMFARRSPGYSVPSLSAGATLAICQASRSNPYGRTCVSALFLVPLTASQSASGFSRTGLSASTPRSATNQQSRRKTHATERPGASR